MRYGLERELIGFVLTCYDCNTVVGIQPTYEKAVAIRNIHRENAHGV